MIPMKSSDYHLLAKIEKKKENGQPVGEIFNKCEKYTKVCREAYEQETGFSTEIGQIQIRS